MISILHAIILGLMQGLTELFPISSLGHSVILPKLFNWNIQQNGSYFLTFLVATHLATAIVLFLFFWREWLKIVRGILRSLRDRRVEHSDTYAKLGWLLIVGTVPAGIIGLALQKKLENLFTSASWAAGFLILNGLILLLAERLRKSRAQAHVVGANDRNIARLSWSNALFVGLAQSAALIPGISRSGSSMAGGLLSGLNNEDAARFSFLLATPVIGAAALLKLPSLLSHKYSSLRGPALAGALAAALAAYLSVRFLMKYFRSGNLKPFAIYCLVAGIALSIYFALH